MADPLPFRGELHAIGDATLYLTSADIQAGLALSLSSDSSTIPVVNLVLTGHQNCTPDDITSGLDVLLSLAQAEAIAAGLQRTVDRLRTYTEENTT